MIDTTVLTAFVIQSEVDMVLRFAHYLETADGAEVVMEE